MCVLASLIGRSFCTGFLAACIVGPIFTLILYRTTTQGLRSGLASAAGMAIADGIFFFIAAMSGISTGRNWIDYIRTFEIVGGPLMVAFGFWTLLKQTQHHYEIIGGGSNSQLIWQTLTAMMLTLSNPLTILFFGAISRQVFPEMVCLSVLQISVASIFLSAGSFSLLTSAIFLIRRQKSINPVNMINFFKTISGLGLILTGSLLCFSHWIAIKKDKTPPFCLAKQNR